MKTILSILTLSTILIGQTKLPNTQLKTPAAAQKQPILIVESPTGIVDGTNGTFTLSKVPNPSYPVLVFKNGLLQAACPVPSTGPCPGDYQQAASSIVFLLSNQTTDGTSTIPEAGGRITVVYWE